MNVKTLAALKPDIRSLRSRTAAFGKTIKQLAENIPPISRARIFAISSYIAISIIIITLLVINTGVKAVQQDTGSQGIPAWNTVRTNSQTQGPGDTGNLLQHVELGTANNYGTSKLSVSPSLAVSITVDGKTRSVWMNNGGTVEDAIKKAGVTIGSSDIVNCSLNAAVNRDTEIRIKRVSYKTIVYTKSFKRKVVKVTSALLTIGKSEVISDGSDGEYTVTAKVKYVDGEKTDEEILKQEVTKESVSKRILVGASIRTPVSKLTFANCSLTSKGMPSNYSRCVTGLATAYSAKKGAGTASGMKAAVGRVAVNRKMFPYGTRLYIVGADGSFVYGYAVAADTGGFAKKNRVLVDLYFNTYKESCEFGARRVKVYVLD